MNQKGLRRKTNFVVAKSRAGQKSQRRGQEKSAISQIGRCRTWAANRFSDAPETLKRFLKNLVSASAASAPVRRNGKWQMNERKKKRRQESWRILPPPNRLIYISAIEAGFSMQPCLPRAWRPAGEQIRLFPQRDKKLNLFGIFRADNAAARYQTKQNINSKFLISAIDDFCRYVEKPTVLVLDNPFGEKLNTNGWSRPITPHLENTSEKSKRFSTALD